MLHCHRNQGQTAAPDCRCLRGHRIKANPISAKEIFIFVQLPLKVLLLLLLQEETRRRQFYRKQRVPNAKISSHDQRAEYRISQENTADPGKDHNIFSTLQKDEVVFKTSNFSVFLGKRLKVKTPDVSETCTGSCLHFRKNQPHVHGNKTQKWPRNM